MNFHVLTVFPEMIESASSFGVVGQAIKSGRLSVQALTPRKFTNNVHQTIDDRPFGGGDGMVMLAEPLGLALDEAKKKAGGRRLVIHLSPRGEPLTDRLARELAGYQDLILVASRYGGVDQRFLNENVDREISIGDYVLSGGELAALVVIDAVARLIPGVLGNEASSEVESFAGPLGLLEAPQFTRPREWHDQEVPAALLSGHHAEIEKWKYALAILVTATRRPDLLKAVSAKDRRVAIKIWESMSAKERTSCGLPSTLPDALTCEEKP